MKKAQIDLSVIRDNVRADTAKCHPLKRSALESTHTDTRKAHPIVDILDPQTFELHFHTHTIYSNQISKKRKIRKFH